MPHLSPVTAIPGGSVPTAPPVDVVEAGEIKHAVGHADSDPAAQFGGMELAGGWEMTTGGPATLMRKETSEACAIEAVWNRTTSDATAKYFPMLLPPPFSVKIRFFQLNPGRPQAGPLDAGSIAIRGGNCAGAISEGADGPPRCASLTVFGR